MDQGCVIEVTNKFVMLFCQCLISTDTVFCKTNSKAQKKTTPKTKGKKNLSWQEEFKNLYQGNVCAIYLQPSNDKFRSSKLNTLKEEKK